MSVLPEEVVRLGMISLQFNCIKSCANTSLLGQIPSGLASLFSTRTSTRSDEESGEPPLKKRRVAKARYTVCDGEQGNALLPQYLTLAKQSVKIVSFHVRLDEWYLTC